MPTTGICLDCNHLYTPPTNNTPALGRCPKCRAQYIARKPRGKHHQTPSRQLAQRFYTSTAWRRTRDQIRKRDAACTQCGNTTHLTVHHIISIKDAPELALDHGNLTTLCRSCHGRHENQTKRRT